MNNFAKKLRGLAPFSDVSVPLFVKFHTYLYKIINFTLSILNLFVSLPPLWRDS